ncbi:CU044_5270 family protein [Streptomyces nitrosporeus]|uniref:CU044_5270 family protein n=1 Tax=Streptomyces nitrosporeus TaxID=28894 RepID=UPI00331CB0D1
MKDDIMDRLAAARPAALDPAAPVPPEVRQRELHRAMSGLGNRPAAPGRARRGIRRPAWTVSAGLATAAVVASVVLTAPGSTGDGAPASGASGRQVLVAAATDVEQQPQEARGRYWHEVTRSGAATEVPGKGYTLTARWQEQVWLASGSDRRWSRHTDLGARPAGPRDEAVWREQGAPRSWTVDGTRLSYEGRGVTQEDAPGGATDQGVLGGLPVSLMDELSSDEKVLREQLRAHLDERYNAPERHLDALVVDAAVQVAMHMPVTPGVRAAAYRLLAGEPDIRALGDVTTPEGRTGRGVGLSSDRAPGTEIQLVFDRGTGAPIGEQRVLTKELDGQPEGTVLDYTTVIAARWTDTAPPFTGDRSRRP